MSLINLDENGVKPVKRTAFNAAALMDDMLGIEAAPAKESDVVEIPIGELVPRKGHKFRPSPKGKRDLLKESIEMYGVIQPVVVRPAEDCSYPVNGKYEILAGHQRTSISVEAGKESVPCIIKRGLNEDEAEMYVTITNIQRSWEELTYSERAAILSDYYGAVKNSGKNQRVLSEINSYLETYANPDNIRVYEGLSPGGTEDVESGIRAVAEEYDLSKNTIARYIRIHQLNDALKQWIDEGEISLKAGVELSYLTGDNQELLVELMKEDGYKCDIKKAQLLRELQEKKKLNHVTMQEVLAELRKKAAPGKPKPFKVNGNIYKKYFSPEQKQKEIDEIIDKALELYFSKESN